MLLLLLMSLQYLIARTMHDCDGPQIAQWVYEDLLEKKTFDLDSIPYALDNSVQRLRKQGAWPARWATFMHMGA
jgi:hypothetical protein